MENTSTMATKIPVGQVESISQKNFRVSPVILIQSSDLLGISISVEVFIVTSYRTIVLILGE